MWICPKCETNNEGDLCIICGAARPAPENPSPAYKPFYVPDLGGPYAGTKSADTPAKPAVAEIEDAAEEFVPDLLGKIHSAKIFVMLCTAFAMILMAIPYRADGGGYSIFSHLGGNVPADPSYKGIIITVSYILLVTTLLPSIFIWIRFNVLQRSVPVAISIVSFSVTTIYCLLLAVELAQINMPLSSVFVWISPLLMGAIALLCAGILKWQKRIDNILYKPRMAPDKPVWPAENPAPPSPPPAAPAPEKNEPRLKSTMRTKHDDMPKGE